jgi:vacuolar protein sorting-associated protein 18
MQKQEYFYKYSPILISNAPDRIVSAWMRIRPPLDPKKLLPALMKYDPKKNPASDPNVRHGGYRRY